MAANFT